MLKAGCGGWNGEIGIRKWSLEKVGCLNRNEGSGRGSYFYRRDPVCTTFVLH